MKLVDLVRLPLHLVVGLVRLVVWTLTLPLRALGVAIAPRRAVRRAVLRPRRRRGALWL